MSTFIITGTKFDHLWPFRVGGSTSFQGQIGPCEALARFLICKDSRFDGSHGPDGHRLRYGGVHIVNCEERRFGIKLLGDNDLGLVVRVYNLIKNDYGHPPFDLFLRLP